MAQVMRQRERNARARGRENRRRSREPDGWRVEHPCHEVILALAQFGALVLEQLPAGSPGQHQKRDDAGQHEREPAALNQLSQVRGNEDQFNKEEEPVDGGDQERVVTSWLPSF